MSGARAPSSYSVMNAVNALAQLRDRLIAVEPSIADDPILMRDMIEGEDTEDYLATIDRVIRCAIEADALADAAKARKADITERQNRFERRRDVLRQVAFEALEVLGIHRRETAEFTASISARPPKVQIVDETALPASYIRTRTEPDKAAIYTALKAGAEIEGATLSNPQRGITIHTK
jgi:hypothetical protein